MANKLLGQVDFVAGSETYHLVFDPNAFCHAEEAMDGATTDDMLEMLRRGKVGFRLIRALLFGGLQANHPCHLVRAGEILSEDATAARKAIMEGVVAAFLGAVEDEEASEPGEARRPKKGRGTG